MKRKIKAQKRSVRSRSHRSAKESPLQIRRIVIITSSLFLLAALVIVPNRHKLNEQVAGASIFNPIYNQATIQLPHLKNAVSYNIYYGETNATSLSNAVRNLPPTSIQYTLAYLKKGVTYKYQLSALDSSGKEFWMSPVMPLTNIQGM